MVGKSLIQQAINALKRARQDWEWRTDDPEAHKALCSDGRIKVIESTAKKNEMVRAEKAYSLKVAGSSAG